MNAANNSNETRKNRLLGLALTTALVTVSLTGCATSAPTAAISASKAESALSSGKYESGLAHAEAAVLADPYNSSYRAMLGAAYLDSGRFGSAATSFDDAAKLGDNSARTALSLALALTAEGKRRDAIQVLDGHRADIAKGDLGLAYALAGKPEIGIHLLTNALRSGKNTAKTRQNLAYSFALAGRWREARLMVAEDVPADQVSDRIAAWATDAHPQAYRLRVAKLLSVPTAVSDPGQPVQLAISNFPTADQLAAEATGSPMASSAPVSAPTPLASAAPNAELPPIGDPIDFAVATNAYQAPQSVQPVDFEAAFATSAPANSKTAAVELNTNRFVENPIVQAIPTSTAPVAVHADGSHLVQLGSFSSKKGAHRAWNIYAMRYPELANHQMVITKATVRGKTFWRVSAAGYNARSSKSMCGRIKTTSSDGCFAYAESRPLPGAVNTKRRLASR